MVATAAASARKPVRRLRRAALLCGAAVACLAAGAAAAAMYKWTDADGRVVYSDQPPPGNVKYEAVVGAPPPANPNAAKDLATQDAEQKKRRLEQAEQAQKADQERAEKARLQATCTEVRTRIRTLQDEQLVLYRFNDRGERVYMNPADRRAELDVQAKWLRENCTN